MASLIKDRIGSVVRLTLMHNTNVVSFPTFGEKEGSRGRQSWAERREGDREARLGVLQETPGKAKES